MIKRKGLRCGVYMAYFVLKALARVGEYGLVYSLITSEGIYSWNNMIREGATTCFESWGKEQKCNTSLCHPWTCAPIPVMIKDVIELTPLTPGWGEIQFGPKLPKSLRELSLNILVKPGRISIEYIDGEYFIYAPSGIEIHKTI